MIPTFLPSPVAEKLMSTTQTPSPTNFTKDQKKFLEKILPQFCAYAARLNGAGPRGVKGVKGAQKDWVRTNVIKKYVEEFSNEENNDKLFKVRI
jgi:hypothetical protein